jgi:6-phosphogluconolactonase
VVAPFVPALGVRRVTLTLRALNSASRIVFLVSGASKAPALARILSEPRATTLPAGRVRPPAGGVLWLVDRAAAGSLARTVPGGSSEYPV